MKKLFFVLFCATTITTLSAQTVFMENEPWADVVAKSKAEGKPIFMDCYTSWCGPCKGLATEIFPQPIVGDYLNANFVCCKYDMEKGEGVDLHNKYIANIPGFPTMLILDSEGNLIHSVVGYQKADALIAALKSGMEGKTLPVFTKRYDDGERSLSFIKEYCEVLDVAYDKEKKATVIKDFVETLPLDSLLNKEILMIYLPYLKDAYTPQYEYVLNNMNDYHYKVNADCYEIESRLASTMSDAVNDLIKLTDSTTNADTLQMAADNEAKLKKMLSKNVKNFSTYYAQLAVNDVKMTGDVVAFDNMLDCESQLDASRSEIFRQRMGEYIINNANQKKQKNLIEKYLKPLEEEQIKTDAKTKEVSMFTTNNYDVMAYAYYRLGNKAKSAECQAKFETMFRQQIDYFKQMLGNEEELDKAYDASVKELRKKLGQE